MRPAVHLATWPPQRRAAVAQLLPVCNALGHAHVSSLGSMFARAVAADGLRVGLPADTVVLCMGTCFFRFNSRMRCLRICCYVSLTSGLLPMVPLLMTSASGSILHPACGTPLSRL